MRILLFLGDNWEIYRKRLDFLHKQLVALLHEHCPWSVPIIHDENMMFGGNPLECTRSQIFPISEMATSTWKK